MKENVLVSDEDVLNAFEWWKKKVIYSRPITKDVPKAYRMIISYLKRRTKK